MKRLFKDALQMSAWLFVAGFLLLGGVKEHVVYARTSDPTPSPAAKEAYLHGVSAADQKDWKLAIKYFGEAQKEAPTWPNALYNLAYSHKQAGGGELIAIAWYRAYLAAAPGAADAEQVRAWIAELEVKFEVRLRKLIQRVKENAGQIKDRWDRANAQKRLVIAQAETGDIAGAKETVSLIPDGVTALRSDATLKDYAMEAIAEGQCDMGDFDGAKETAARIIGRTKFIVYKIIAEAQAEAGDIVGAKETAAQIPEEDSKAGAYWEILKAQAKAGDIAGAKMTAALIPYKNTKTEIEFAEAKKGSYAEVDRAQAQVEEIESWTELAIIRIWRWRGSKEELEDWQGFLESFKDEDPNKVVISLSEAVLKMGYALHTIRTEEATWQKRRKK